MGSPLATAVARLDGDRDSLPRAFGRYVLFDRIGRGGMADIFLASAHTELEATRLAVVKRILPELSGDPIFAQMLIEEAKLAAHLNHANITQVFDLDREDSHLYIGMEYVEGYDLNQLLRRLTDARVPLPAEFALFVVAEVLRGLAYAHRAKTEAGTPMGLVHRDVSPSNVLVSFEGEVKLCDFGIARAYGLVAGPREITFSPETTSVGRAPSAEEPNVVPRLPKRTSVAGKGGYMSPEHALGLRIDARADVFSVGVVLWQLCAGRRLYRGTEDEIFAQACVGKIPPLPERGMPEHEALQAILDRALAFDPDERYPSAQAMLYDLERYADRNMLIASQLKFGAFLTEHFADEIVHVRREREQASEEAMFALRRPHAQSGMRLRIGDPVDEIEQDIAPLFSDEEDLEDSELAIDHSTVRPLARIDGGDVKSLSELAIALAASAEPTRSEPPFAGSAVAEPDAPIVPTLLAQPEPSLSPDPSQELMPISSPEPMTSTPEPVPPLRDELPPPARDLAPSMEVPLPEGDDDDERVFPSAAQTRASRPPEDPSTSPRISKRPKVSSRPPTVAREDRRSTRAQRARLRAVPPPPPALMRSPGVMLLGLAIGIAALIAYALLH